MKEETKINKLKHQYKREAYRVGLSKVDAEDYAEYRLQGMNPDDAYTAIINDILRQV